MIKFNLSIITIILIYVITVISSTPKENPVVGDNYAQNNAVNLNSNQNKMKYPPTPETQDQISNFPLNAKMKIQNKTSLYTGVSWHSDNKKWQTNLKHNGKQNYGGLFDNEKHAAMKINLLCDEYGIKRKNSTIDIEPAAMQKVQNTTSIYTGVSWNSDNKKWQTNLCHNKKQYYGGLFDNEEHAAMKINLLCDENGIKRKNLKIEIKPHVIQKIRNQTSNYHGVCWKTGHKKWKTQLNHNGKQYCGGYFDNEEHAAMKVNLLCDDNGIKRKNPTIDTEIHVIPKIKNTTSIYTGVSWKSENKKWEAQLSHNKKSHYGGYFDNEEHAAMRVNLLCDEHGIMRKNLTIDIELHVTAPKIKTKTSIYSGVSWQASHKKWKTDLQHNGKQNYGGLFDNEENAAMKINLLCDEHGIKRKNLTIDIELDVTPKKLKSKIDQSKKENIIKTEEESIRYGFKDQCENNFIKSEEKESHNDTAALCYKIQKRKRTKQLDYK